MFSANQTDANMRKDTTINVETTRAFVWNICTWDLREAMNITSEQIMYGQDEFERAGLEKAMSQFLEHEVPMVAQSPIRFECDYHSTIRLPGNPPMGTVDIIIGKVKAIHIADQVLSEGLIDLSKVQPIARCGYYTYAVVRETFEMKPPGNGKMAYGLEGNVTANAKEFEDRRAAQRLRESNDDSRTV